MSREQIIERIKKSSDEDVVRLSRMLEELEQKQSRKARIMSLAGSWSEWPEEGFTAWMKEMAGRRQQKQTRQDLR